MSIRRMRQVAVLIVLAAVAAGAAAWWHAGALRRDVSLWIEGEPTPDEDGPVNQRGAAGMLRRRSGSETGSGGHVLSPYAFRDVDAGPRFRFELDRAIPDARIVVRYARERVVAYFEDVGPREYTGGAKINLTLEGPHTVRTAMMTFPTTGGVGVCGDQWRVRSLDLGRLEAGAWTLSMAAPADPDPRLPPPCTCWCWTVCGSFRAVGGRRGPTRRPAAWIASVAARPAGSG